ncbi:MAG: septum site-determining protein MinC [Parvibaculaceae bacterium]
MTTVAQARSVFRFRGRSFLHFVLTPELPLREWLADADSWLSRSPGFFTGKPVVLDVSSLALGRYEITVLIEDLAQRGIKVLGLEGADPDWNVGGLPPLLRGGRPTDLGVAPSPPADAAQGASEHPPVAMSEPAPLRLAATLVIDQPVRSGQTIEHPEGDVTVIGSVGSGAEIIAGGSIHVYGSLRGRALAGTNGDGRARIFCRRLEAELVAIDGYYRIAEELDPHLLKRPAHAWLEDTTLNIAALD